MIQALKQIAQPIVCDHEPGRIEELEQQAEELQAELDDAQTDLGDRIDIEIEEVTTDFIDEAIADSLDVLRRPDPYDQQDNAMYRIWMDNTYWVPTREDFEGLLGMTEASDFEYVKDKFDCENFAEAFRTRMSEQFGITSVGLVGQWNDDAHVFNVVIYADGTADLIEPQNGEIVAESDANKYDLNEGVFWI